jgi:hypothetical protein
MGHPKCNRFLRSFEEYGQIERSLTSLKDFLEFDGLGQSAWKTVKQECLAVLIEPLSDQRENEIIRCQRTLADDATRFSTHQSIQLSFPSQDRTGRGNRNLELSLN